ncbi:MAG: acyl carrier protein [Vicinamibacterales bacterium]
MTKAEFLRILEGELELPPSSLSEGQTLSAVDGWDSMSALLFIAMADEKLGATVSGEQIAKSRTVGDLLSLLGGKLTD